MKKTIAIIIIVAVITGVVGAFTLIQSNQKTTANTSDNMSDTNSKNSNNNKLRATVIVENGTINPSNLTVKEGTTVEWIIKDPNPNNKYMITSNKTEKEGMYLFMSDHLANGQSFSYTFIGNGTYYYYDMDHMDDNNLTGTIIVQ